MKTDTSFVAIKGTKHGLTITLQPGPLDNVLIELNERLQRTAAFFRGAQVTLNVENPDVSSATLNEISALLVQHDIVLREVNAADPQLSSPFESLGSASETRAAISQPHREPPENSSARASTSAAAASDGDESDTYPAIVVRRTMRGGAAVQHEGHVIIIGDVNPGAEVIAAGDVIVWGKLRGLVHAGALGDNSAIVCALLFEPTQLRIGNAIARMPERKKRGRHAPEMASIRNGKIEVVEWS